MYKRQVYHIIKSREDLKNILKDVKAQQEADSKLGNIRRSVLEGDEVINKILLYTRRCV